MQDACENVGGSFGGDRTRMRTEALEDRSHPSLNQSAFLASSALKTDPCEALWQIHGQRRRLWQTV